MTAMILQPPFDSRLTTKVFPLSGSLSGSATLQTGYMIWDKPMSGYSGLASIQYLYNPSTVSADFNTADANAQAAMDFPNPGDTANWAIPLSQTATWSLMFDRTFELWGSYGAAGVPNNYNANGGGGHDPSTIGVQADVLAFMQFTGMLANWSPGSAQSAAGAQSNLLAGNSGVMAMWPSWAVFGNNNVQNGLMYYGYISEWSVQYTHWTQYNVPMRCVISVNWTMIPMPASQPPALPEITTLPNGQPGPGAVGVGGVGPGVPVINPITGVGGR